MTNWRTLEEFESELLEDKDFRAEFEAATPAWEIARLILLARLSIGMSQKDLAAAVGTSQSRVSKWESGEETPRIDALQRVAEATGRVLTVGLEPAGAVDIDIGGTDIADIRTHTRKAAVRSTAARGSTRDRKTSARRTARRKTTRRRATARKTAARRKTTARRSAAARRKARRS